VFDHLGGLAELGDVAAPEGWPGLVPFLEAGGEEGDGVEDGPGAVGEVAGICQSICSEGRRTKVWWDSQHAIRLVPFQIMLHIYRGLRLYCETDQAYNQKCSGICISFPRRLRRV